MGLQGVRHAKTTELNWYISFSTSGLQHARPPCPSPTTRVYPNSCPSSQWCHPTISSSVVPLSSCLQSFPISGPFPISQCSASGGQGIRASASASDLPKNIQDWFPLGWTGGSPWALKISLRVQGTLKSVYTYIHFQRIMYFAKILTYTMTSIQPSD